MIGMNAAQAYSSARAAVAPRASADAPPPSALGQVADGFAQTMAGVDAAATGAMTGAVETHDLVQTLTEAQLAFDTVVAIRDRVVEAYQEILRMPV